MPPKFEKNPNDLSNRQKRRRIEFLRRNVQNENVAQESSSSSASSAASNVSNVDMPVEPFVDNGIDDLEELHDERQSDDDSDTESSDRVTISSHEHDFADDDDRNFILEDNELSEDGNNSDESNLNDDLNVNLQEDIATISRRKIKNAFLSAGLTHTQGNIILKTLREYRFQYLHLPKDSRTVLNTPAFVASRFVYETAGGEYLHIGFQDGLLKKLSYRELRKYGGTKIREALNFAFKRSISDKLATEFTWCGEKETTKFGDSKMAALFFRVMQKCPNFPEPESQTAFKLEMIEVLRNAKQRYRNSLKPRRKNRIDHDIEEEEHDFLFEEEDDENARLYGSNNNSENEYFQLSKDIQNDTEDSQSERNDSSLNESGV